MKLRVYVKSLKSRNSKSNILDYIEYRLTSHFDNLLIVDYEELKKQDINNIEYLYISGGDGFVHKVINYTYNINQTIIYGLIPIGTANDICRGLGIKNVFSAIDLIIENKVYNYNYDTKVTSLDTKVSSLDSFVITDLKNKKNIISMYAISCGTMSKVSNQSKKSEKRIFGKFIYVIKGILYYFKRKSIIYINSKKIKLKALIVTNSKTLGGYKIRKRFDDTIGYYKIKSVFDIIAMFIFHTKSKINFEEIKVSCNGVWSIDGEEYDLTDVLIQKNKKKIKMLSKST